MTKNVQTVSFKILELDCQEEARIIKKALSTHKGIKHLEFQILQAKLEVTYDPSSIDRQTIVGLIHSTGMTPSLLGSVLPERKFWEKHSREMFSFLSGLFLLLAAILQAVYHPNFFQGIEDFFTFKDGTLPFISIFFYGASILFGTWFVIPKAIRSMKLRQADMHVLMIIAVLGACFIKQWFEAASVAFLFSVSVLMEHWSLEKARRSISSLLDLKPETARIEVGAGNYKETPVEKVEIGSIFHIRPGEKIPLDAEVVKGVSSVNQSSITGESIPVSKSPGDAVFAGTLNEEGELLCKATKKADETTLSKIIHMVQEAQSRKASYERWSEQFARIYTPIMIALSASVMILPPLLYGQAWVDWFYRGLVLLVIACPCALVISTPVSIVSGLTSAAREGILIKGGLFLEAIGTIQAIAFDKTGTLTQGHPKLQNIIALQGHTEEEVLSKAASLEAPVHHPLARAISNEAKKKQIPLFPISEFVLMQGKGATATLKGKRFWIGSHRFMHEMGQETSLIHDLALQLEDAGHSIVALGNNEHVCGLISIADSPRPYVTETISSIKQLGIKQTIMLTGDNLPTATAIAKHTKVDRFYAELLPEDKVRHIDLLKKEFGHIAMVGDGVNDAPAMSLATVSIAMGEMGTDAAFESADIVLMGDDLSQIPKLIRHSRRSRYIIQQNISIAIGVKSIVLLLAVFGFASLWAAIAADSGASLVVVMNALRLLKRPH